MRLDDVALVWAKSKARQAEEDQRRRDQIIESRRRAGLASAAARIAKYGRGGVVDHLRGIARSGGKARYATLSESERRELSVRGGRISWAKLTPEQARLKRHLAGEASKRVLTHEQRVINGKRGAEKRWHHAA